MNRHDRHYDIGNTELVGPWPCEKCHQLSQYAIATPDENHIFCKNESCDYKRIVDKRRSRIVEDDGTIWAFDGDGNKWRVRA